MPGFVHYDILSFSNVMTVYNYMSASSELEVTITSPSFAFLHLSGIAGDVSFTRATLLQCVPQLYIIFWCGHSKA